MSSPAAGELTVNGLCKSFGATRVLHGVDLHAPAGRLTAILGPSGCGKTTLLRLVAGFDVPDGGTVSIAGRVVCDDRGVLPPESRRVGYVAQEGALFPHLTVAGNITFGLPRAARKSGSRASELLELVGMERSYASRYPHELSGGQQQRVALARALAPRPSLILLDEPFSALDATLRAETRTAVTHALAAAGTTAVLVTHDQSEALSLADQVAVLRGGRLRQIATPAEIYSTPADRDVAGSVGDVVVLPARIRDHHAICALGAIPVRPPGHSGDTDVLLRPEQILMHTGKRATGTPATVQTCTYYGHDATVALRLHADGTIVMTRCAGHALPSPGTEVTLTVHGHALALPSH